MADREKVIKGLECCFDALVQEEHAFAENGVVMSSWQDRAKRIDAIREAIAFLKAQEPGVDGKSQEVISGFTQYCPNCGFANTCCGTISPRENTVFHCEKCGTEVKWE